MDSFAIVAPCTPFARVRIIHTEYEPHTGSWCGELKGEPGFMAYCSTQARAIIACTRFASSGQMFGTEQAA